MVVAQQTHKVTVLIIQDLQAICYFCDQDIDDSDNDDDYGDDDERDNNALRVCWVCWRSAN